MVFLGLEDLIEDEYWLIVIMMKREGNGVMFGYM